MATLLKTPGIPLLQLSACRHGTTVFWVFSRQEIFKQSVCFVEAGKIHLIYTTVIADFKEG